MEINIHLYIHAGAEVTARLDAQDRKLDLILDKEDIIMKELDDLEAAIAAEDTVIDGAIVLIQGIPALIAAAGVDPAKLAALSADITAKSTALAAAVATAPGGTPAPNPPPPPVTQ